MIPANHGEPRDQHDSKAKPAAEAEVEEPHPKGLGAKFRQLIEQARQGQSRSNIKRQQLKEDRTQSLLLAGSMVVALM